jgi:adenylate cyclase
MTSQPPIDTPKPTDKESKWAHTLWHSYLTGDVSQLRPSVMITRRIFKQLPTDPRCKVCNAPFRGIGGAIVNVFGFGSGHSVFNPHLCDRCEKIVKKHAVGLEMPLTMLFADVRGSTPLAEEIGAAAFHQLINRYYQTCVEVLTDSDALINRFVGDAAIGLYVPGIAGPDYVRKAIEAGRALLAATGHNDPSGPWIRVGVGIHTGNTYVGAVGDRNSVNDITVLGDAANTTSRLSSVAQQGEVLVSEETCRLADLNLEDCETRTLNLKGRSEPVTVRVIRVAP